MTTQGASSTVLGSMYSGYNPTIYTIDPTKVVKKYEFFCFEEDENDTPWHVSSPLNMNPTRKPLPKFKDYLPKFLGIGTCMVEDHLNSFSNACHNIGANNNDTCMRLFVNSLEGKETTNFFDLPAKFFSTWEELCYWFRSTFGQPQTPVDWLKAYNNIIYHPGESIKTFNLRVTKLFNRILENILPQNQVAMIHYYNTLPPIYRNNLEQKGVTELSTTLQACLEYEEQASRTRLPLIDSNKNINLSAFI